MSGFLCILYVTVVPEASTSQFYVFDSFSPSYRYACTYAVLFQTLMTLGIPWLFKEDPTAQQQRATQGSPGGPAGSPGTAGAGGPSGGQGTSGRLGQLPGKEGEGHQGFDKLMWIVD